MKKLFAMLFTFILLGSAVSALADSWVCTNCGKESEGNYCSWCASPKPSEKVVCSNCGAEFDADAGYAFCNNCAAPLQQNSRKPVSVGDIITFGNYEQDNNLDNGSEPIEWIVLDVLDGKALLLSKYGLDAKPYEAGTQSITWETCTLRSWLNNDFKDSAFNMNEQKIILITNVDNSSSQNWSISGGNNTTDQIFLLSCAEAHQYLNVESKNVNANNSIHTRIIPTTYAIAQGARIKDSDQSEEGTLTGVWWLRSLGSNYRRAACVLNDGSLDYDAVHYKDFVVRPALWVDLNSGIF